MPKKTATRKRVKAVKRQVSSIDTTLKDTVDSNSEKNWDLDFKINEDFKLTPNQVEFLVKSLQQDTRMCMVDGPAGTAKTYLAVLTALKMLNRKQIDNIIYIRSIVESASRSMGALPGELEEKFAPWSMPLVDKLEEITTAGAGSNLMNKGYIKCIPVNFTRGLTFKNACVIIDEAQNMTNSELTTILTRFGENSKYLVVGDTLQADIGVKSGFKNILNAFDDQSCVDNGITTFRFDEDDIVRSEILRFIVKRLNTIH
jgi:phosphate starvation-inducible PhoH-like protein|tara:strand:+ start:28 stop:801 length:774 start_codon:yes stop_codon:yes gene_type:complete